VGRLVAEKAGLEGELARERGKSSHQLGNHREENENLKKQLFMLDKQSQQQHSKLLDEIDNLQGRLDRSHKESERYKRKYGESVDATTKLLADMDSYQKILETLEANVRQISAEKDRAERERDKALHEVRLVRARYSSIVGADQFSKDFS
jgi:chromosome segregation ATPase